MKNKALLSFLFAAITALSAVTSCKSGSQSGQAADAIDHHGV